MQTEVCIKCQILFFWEKNKKYITSLLFAKIAHSVLRVNEKLFDLKIYQGIYPVVRLI